MTDLYAGALTDVAGLLVGHADDAAALTGCTVVLCPGGAGASGVVRGLAPGTREMALLDPGTLVDRVHGILLSGGSAFGLDAAGGVMRYLEEHKIGFDASGYRVPIVPGAVLFDLAVGDGSVRPDAAMGYRACQAASADEARQGNVGAGMGASVGKLLGIHQAMKGGLGMASLRAGKLVVSALVAVNAFGDVVDPAQSGAIIAGCRKPLAGGLIDTAQALRSPLGRKALSFGNTTIGVVASNARLDTAQLQHVASSAHNGLARVIRPAHTLYDGDTMFALSTHQIDSHELLVSDMAADVMAYAILNAVRAARPLGGLPSVS